MENIPENKSRISHDIISGEELISNVKLEIEINGVKITSTGYENTTQVSIITYKSIASLEKEGYLKNKRIKKLGEED